MLENHHGDIVNSQITPNLANFGNGILLDFVKQDNLMPQSLNSE